MISLGDREVAEKTADVRDRKGAKFGAMSVEDLVAKLKKEIEDKVHD